MSNWISTATIGAGLLAIAGVAAYGGMHLQRARQERYIREFMLPQGLFRKLQEKRPGIDSKYHSLVARALRHFFLCHLASGRKYVSMPSQVVDDLWHEFILYTRNYQDFCSKAFGGYMHHTPAVALGPGQGDDMGLKRAWHYACKEENINPRAPSRLPLLFAIDAKLGIEDGFRYLPDCSNRKADGDGNIYCGADLGADSGGDIGSGDSWFGSGDGVADSGGSSCGGGGCGGGGE